MIVRRHRDRVGTFVGGWRIIRTLAPHHRDRAPQGFTAETSSATVILAASQAGFPLSTTHVTSGSVMGAGVGRRAAEVHWGVAGQMAMAWLVTIPAAGALAAAFYLLTDALGPDIAGPVGGLAAGRRRRRLAVPLDAAIGRDPRGGRLMIDWTALGQVVVYSFAGALAVTLLFTSGGPARQRASARGAACGRGRRLCRQLGPGGAGPLRDVHHQVVRAASCRCRRPRHRCRRASGQSRSRGCCCSSCCTGAVEGSGVVEEAVSPAASA